MTEYEVRCHSPQGRVRNLNVSGSFGTARTVEATLFGDVAPTAVTLESMRDGVPQGALTYALSGGEETGGFDLQTGTYRGRRSPEVELGRYRTANPAFTAKPVYDAELSDAYPSAPSAEVTTSTEERARASLTKAGYNLVVYDGPGIYRGEPGGETGDVDTLSFLQSTLLATGARYWIDDDTLYIDGRALPAGFTFPSADAHLITAYSWRDEFALDGYDPDTDPEPEPDEEELELPPEPDKEDYLSRCPDYSGQPPGYEPPQVTPEGGDGTFTYEMTAGTGDDRTRVSRTNTYDAGRLVRAETTEEGYIAKPDGKVFALRTKTVTTAKYHPLCPMAMVEQREQTFVAPELTDLPGETNPTEVEQAAEVYYALLGKANNDGLYLQSERVETFGYHLEGWLQKSLEVNRELSVLSYRAPADPQGEITLNLSYDTRTRSVLWEPLPKGQWVCYTLDRQTENVVVYETSPGTDGEPDTSAPATVQKVSRSTPSVHGGDQAPPQINCPEPDKKPDKGYFWDFGDGTTRQGGPNEVHTYEGDGVYSVSVVFTAPDGTTYDGSGTAATGATGQPSIGSGRALDLDVVAAPGLDNKRFYFYTSRSIGCQQRKEEEFEDDHQEWEEEKEDKTERYKQERVNVQNVSKRVHSYTFGVLRLDLKLNDPYAGGLIAGVTHGYQNSGQSVTASTELTVWERL